MRELSVIIVSYNTRGHTRRCLASLADALAGIDAEVIVVDNASIDGSAEMIRAEFPAARVIDNPVNAGFGAANNVGMAATTSEFVLLLNSDAFPDPDAVQIMLNEMRRQPDVAVVGPRLRNADGSLQRSVFRFPSPLHAVLENLWLSRALARLGVRKDYECWPHNAAERVPWVVGACMLVRRDAITGTGGFDERFFMYSEETDWQKRIRDLDAAIYFTPRAGVVHLGGASGAGDRPKTNRQFFESLDRYVLKHHGRAGLVVFRGAMVAGCGLRGTLWWTLGRVRRASRPIASAKSSFHWWLARRQLVSGLSDLAPRGKCS